MADPVDPPASNRAARREPGGGVETLEGDAAAQPAEHDAAGHAGSARRGGRTRLLADARIAWAVALIAVLAAAMLGVQWQSLRADAAAREDVREAAEIIVARATTFEGATIDGYVSEMRALATGEYAAQVTELFDQEFRDALREGEVESVGEVSRSFVQDLDDDEAEVFVLVRQTSTNAARDELIEDELRMEVTLRRVDGQWLAADVAVLGPPGAGLPPPPDPEQG